MADGIRTDAKHSGDATSCVDLMLGAHAEAKFTELDEDRCLRALGITKLHSGVIECANKLSAGHCFSLVYQDCNFSLCPFATILSEQFASAFL